MQRLISMLPDELQIEESILLEAAKEPTVKEAITHAQEKLHHNLTPIEMVHLAHCIQEEMDRQRDERLIISLSNLCGMLQDMEGNC